MATFGTTITKEDRAAVAKDLGWDAVPTDQPAWDARLQKTSVVVDPLTTKYVATLCAAGTDVQSGAEKAYIAQHSGACPWKETNDKDRRRMFQSTDPTERSTARQKICERYWNDPDGAQPTVEERQFLEATGSRDCAWSDMSDAWKRTMAVDSSGGKSDDARWKPTFNAVCDRLPWERTDDERRIVSNLCNNNGGTFCAPCEVRCATGSPDRHMMVIGAAVVLVLFLIIVLR